MPSFNIHLAVGKCYCDKNNYSYSSYFKGLLDPDIICDKNTHYSGVRDKNKILECLENKVNLYWFVSENKLDDDYSKAYFLHLITDYLFFNYYMDKEYLLSVGYDTFCKDLYYSYDLTNKYLETQYCLDYPMYKQEILNSIHHDLREKKIQKKKYKNILPFGQLDSFIKTVSNINLENYFLKIKNAGKNVLPDELEEK